MAKEKISCPSGRCAARNTAAVDPDIHSGSGADVDDRDSAARWTVSEAISPRAILNKTLRIRAELRLAILISGRRATTS